MKMSLISLLFTCSTPTQLYRFISNLHVLGLIELKVNEKRFSSLRIRLSGKFYHIDCECLIPIYRIYLYVSVYASVVCTLYS